jgi:hypothetical protein
MVDVRDDGHVADVGTVPEVGIVGISRCLEEGLVVGGHDEPRYRPFTSERSARDRTE